LFNSVANVPDIFITVGTIGLSLSIFYAIYKINMKSEDEDEDINVENIVDEIIKN
jgi:lipoprotein signal peptidase